MEKDLTNEEERAFLLQQTKSFDELNTEERMFILGMMTSSDYDLGNRIFQESKELHNVPKPVPLVLPKKVRSFTTLLILPLSTAAAAAVLTFFFIRREVKLEHELVRKVYLTADTVYIHDQHVDTVFKTVEVPQVVYRQKATEAPVQVQLREPSEFKEEIPPLSLIDIKNKGVPASEDKTFLLLVENGKPVL